jgi:hypothetical protein
LQGGASRGGFEGMASKYLPTTRDLKANERFLNKQVQKARSKKPSSLLPVNKPKK